MRNIAAKHAADVLHGYGRGVGGYQIQIQIEMYANLLKPETL
jgi:hypothetical protein